MNLLDCKIAFVGAKATWRPEMRGRAVELAGMVFVCQTSRVHAQIVAQLKLLQDGLAEGSAEQSQTETASETEANK